MTSNNGGTPITEVFSSRIESPVQISNSEGSIIRLGATQPDGAETNVNNGTLVCIGSFNAGFVELPTDCIP